MSLKEDGVLRTRRRRRRGRGGGGLVETGPVAEWRIERSWLGLTEMEVSLLRCQELCRLLPSKRRKASPERNVLSGM